MVLELDFGSKFTIISQLCLPMSLCAITRLSDG